jgi:gamma-glutamyl:cysteine ligase YbdK (ATP-grasp superfamily)
MTKSKITPPIELVQQWMTEARSQDYVCITEQVADRAAQWGADQELEACCELLDSLGGDGEMIRRYRRPKPSSLKEQAQQSLLRLASHSNSLMSEDAADADTIRKALEALPND